MPPAGFRGHGRLCVHGGLRGTFLLDLGEGLAGGVVSCLDLGRGGEPTDNHITITRIELDTVVPIKNSIPPSFRPRLVMSIRTRTGISHFSPSRKNPMFSAVDRVSGRDKAYRDPNGLVCCGWTAIPYRLNWAVPKGVLRRKPYMVRKSVGRKAVGVRVPPSAPTPVAR